MSKPRNKVNVIIIASEKILVGTFAIVATKKPIISAIILNQKTIGSLDLHVGNSKLKSSYEF